MTLWLVQTIATSLIAVLLSLLCVRWLASPGANGSADIEACLNELAEVESKLRQGSIDDAEADAARLDIRRRTLAGRPALRLIPGRSAAPSEFAMACVAAVVIAGAVGLYAATGDSGASASLQPAAERQVATPPIEDAPVVKRLAAVTLAPAAEGWGQQSRPRSGLPSVEEMIQRLATRLEKNPADTEGWRTLGWSYVNIGRFAEASDAYAKAIELSPGNLELRTARIDAMMRASTDGQVTADAAQAIDDVLKLDQRNARARFFKALAKRQQGQRTAALTDCVELLKEVKADEPWLPELKSTIADIERDLGMDTTLPAAGPKSAVSTDVIDALRKEAQLPSPIEKGPSAQDVAAAEAMSPEDRSNMIRGMVDGLAERLKQSPRDAEGWIKLIRSRMVLGETEQARQALSHSMEIFADDEKARDRIVASARELGLD